VKRNSSIFILLLMLCSACEWKLKPNDDETLNQRVEIQRYDRLQSMYLTTADFAALQQMETSYPMETRALIENVLMLGSIDSPDINRKFLAFYQDSTLQTILSDAEAMYANMDDVNKKLNDAIDRLRHDVPGIPVPRFYAQVGALGQSIIVGDESVGISLDKYLGADYPLYAKYYPEQTRITMDRKHIIPDCLSFYLLSLYPLTDFEFRNQIDRDLHMGKVMWVTNRCMGQRFFNNRFVQIVDRFMKNNPGITVEALLKMTDYSQLK
jgi:hypothetical protein